MLQLKGTETKVYHPEGEQLPKITMHNLTDNGFGMRYTRDGIHLIGATIQIKNGEISIMPYLGMKSEDGYVLSSFVMFKNGKLFLMEREHLAFSQPLELEISAKGLQAEGLPFVYFERDEEASKRVRRD